MVAFENAESGAVDFKGLTIRASCGSCLDRRQLIAFQSGLSERVICM